MCGGAPPPPLIAKNLRSSVISIAQHVSPSVAFPAQLVFIFSLSAEILTICAFDQSMNMTKIASRENL